MADAHPGTAITLARATSQLRAEVKAISAGSGIESLKQIAGDSVDIFITNMLMRGMNGLELIEQMQSNSGGCPSYII